VTETALTFGDEGALVGVLTTPADMRKRSHSHAVILLNSGIVHRVGVNRLYVKLARQVAALGVPVLRFDFAGIGDSLHRRDSTGFVPAAIAETREAMSLVGPLTGADRFVLIGICSGAVIAFRTALADARAHAAVLINPLGHLHGEACLVSESYLSKVRSRHYLRLAMRSSFRQSIWLRAVTGRIDLIPMLGAFRKGFRLSKGLSRPTDEDGAVDAAREMMLLTDRGVRLKEIHAEADEGLDYVRLRLGPRADEIWRRPGMSHEVIKCANHTFTRLWAQQQLLASITEWVAAL
jgi:pimeloyl-ACP methyl ester carboxylesterase